MIVKIDTSNKRLIYNEKVFHIDPFAVMSMAQVGYKIEVIHVDPNAVVTVKLTMSTNETRP